jgi:ribonuclease E
MTVAHPSDSTRSPIAGAPPGEFAGGSARARTLSPFSRFLATGLASRWPGPGSPPTAASPRRARSDEDPPLELAGSSADGDPGTLARGSDEGAPPRRRRRGSRGGRGRNKARAQAPVQDEGAAPVDADDAAPELERGLPFDGIPGEVDLDAPRPARQPGLGRPREIDEVETEGVEAADAAGDSPPGAADEGRPRRRRGRRGGRRRRRGGRGEPGAAAGTQPEGDRPTGGEFEEEERRLEASEADVEEPEDGPADDGGSATGRDGGPGRKKKRRRRGSRGGRRRRADGPTPVEVEAIPGEGQEDLPEVPRPVVEDEAEPAEAREDAGRKGRGRRRRGAPPPEEDDDEAPVERPELLKKALILVNAADPEEKRVAVVEDGQISDFQMTVRTENSVVNDIYRGRVVNLEPAIGAAFVDFGQGRNGFLHTSDVLSAYGDSDWSLDKLLTTAIDPEEWDSNSSQPGVAAELGDDDRPAAPKARARPSRKEHGRRFRARPRLPITDLLKKGEMVVVQVTKDAIGDKGPTLTTYISIPGRYLVLMPSMSRTGVSRKIEDEKERRRLKKILQQLEIPAGMGVIVRTAGVGRSKADLRRDLDYLKGAWESFARRLRHGHGPAPLYQESDIAIRTVRDLFTPGTEAVVVDDPQVHQQILEFTQKLMPEAIDRVKLYTGPKPLFHSYACESDFEKIFARRIELPSGGSIVFDQAEALVAIDVNSGRTRSDGFDFEQIALKTNLEAAPEIARQIRLRDLGGIIVVDFIDMMKLSNIKAVERAFKAALDSDRARSKLGRISQFGLLELTRQRLGPGMSRKVFTTCHRCRGTGRIRTVESRAAAILRRLGSAMTLKGFTNVEVRAHPEVVTYLRNECSEYLRALEYRFEREIKLHEAPEQVEDSVLRYLRADGREVRPGGRRKR